MQHTFADSRSQVSDGEGPRFQPSKHRERSQQVLGVRTRVGVQTLTKHQQA